MEVVYKVMICLEYHLL